MRSTNNGIGMPAILLAAAFLFGAVSATCQQSANPSNASSQTGNSKSRQRDKASKPASQSDSGNTFPLAQSEAVARAAAQRTSQQSADSANPNATGTSKAANASKSAAEKDNPFPQVQSEAAAKREEANDGTASSNPEAPAAGSGSYSSSNAHLPPPELGQGNLPSHEKMDTFTRDHTQDGRIEDDLKVADFYMKNGNYRGALLRYQDALESDPQNDTASYGVAESLCKQNRTAEAMAHFKSYAKGNPQGKYALKAEKMLAHPSKCAHNF